ncbi:MAG: hypothetical protein GXO65_06255 [Euryarchaeota archaeon]|nr:hypothetical protein [Euryarchaeota archaeon]
MSIDEWSRRRVEGMIRAYLEGRQSLNWIYGQITKAHTIEEAFYVIKENKKWFMDINKEKLEELANKLDINLQNIGEM